MPLLNYTTTVPANRTIGQVQALLVEAGARSIMTSYDDVGRAMGVTFAVQTAFGMRSFMLPVSADRVEAVLRREKVPPKFQTPEHAERVAWRIVKDWLEAQLAIIRTEMVTLDQVMLPYMHDDSGRTVYELYRDRQPPHRLHRRGASDTTLWRSRHHERYPPTRPPAGGSLEPPIHEMDQAERIAFGFLASYPPITRNTYRIALRQWFTWCHQHDIDVLAAERMHIEVWLRYLQEERGLMGSTACGKLGAVSGFYKAPSSTGTSPANPAAYVRRPKTDEESHSTWLGRTQLHDFLAEAEERPVRPAARPRPLLPVRPQRHARQRGDRHRPRAHRPRERLRRRHHPPQGREQPDAAAVLRHRVGGAAAPSSRSAATPARCSSRRPAGAAPATTPTGSSATPPSAPGSTSAASSTRTACATRSPP
jgi:hypothetical protein